MKNEMFHIRDTIDIAETPILKEAQDLAKLYYERWLKVNHDLITG
jgi:hypothetical protein